MALHRNALPESLSGSFRSPRPETHSPEKEVAHLSWSRQDAGNKQGVSVVSINHRYIGNAAKDSVEPPVYAPLMDPA